MSVTVVNLYLTAPPKPDYLVLPTEVSRSAHSIRIRFRKNYFSDENGRVMRYSVIVAEDDSKSLSDRRDLPSWNDVQGYSIWPPYQVRKKATQL